MDFTSIIMLFLAVQTYAYFACLVEVELADWKETFRTSVSSWWNHDEDDL